MGGRVAEGREVRSSEKKLRGMWKGDGRLE